MTNVVPIQSTEAKISEAAAAWLDAKQAEEAANAKRIDAEQKLTALIEHKTEGATKMEVGLYRITLTGKLTRALEAEKIDALATRIPIPVLQRLVQYKPSLNLKELRYIEANEPQHYRVFAEALTIKPAKTAVSIELK